ncbi:MAG: HAMP domain-containing protein [Elusimicrobia bacterium]|nr:HAMP domain-containing protein [Elusimicrobiota bacterium]
MSFQTKVTLVFASFCSLLFLAAGSLLYRDFSYRLRRDIGFELCAVAVTTAMQLDGDEIQAFVKPEDMKKPSYVKMRRLLASVRKATAFLSVEDLCLFRRTATPNKWEYIVDADETPDQANLGDPFDATTWHEMRAAYDGPTLDRDFHRDEQGAYLSGYAPVHNKHGDAVAVLEVYTNAVTFKDILRRVRTGMLQILAGVLLLTWPCSFVLGRLLSRPLRELARAAEEVGKGNFDHAVSLPRGGEFDALGQAFIKMTAGLKERDFVKQVIQRYVSKEVAAKIMEMPLAELLAGERRRVTVLFTDVRSFTGMAEKMRPEEVLQILNDHFSILIDALFDFEGTLDKFLGDGLMAIFGAPITHPNDAERAVRAGLRMLARIEGFNLRQRSAGKPELRIGIGVNTGTAVAGNIGSDKRKEYSVIGDTVNVAARLQGLAKAGELVISQTTYEEIRDLVKVEKLPPQTLKGKDGPVDVYRVLAID